MGVCVCVFDAVVEVEEDGVTVGEVVSELEGVPVLDGVPVNDGVAMPAIGSIVVNI